MTDLDKVRAESIRAEIKAAEHWFEKYRKEIRDLIDFTDRNDADFILYRAKRMANLNNKINELATELADLEYEED